MFLTHSGMFPYKSLTCKGLVPLADAIWFSTKPLNVFQIGFRMKKPLCLWWRGDKHGSWGLLHDRLTCWALAWIRRGRLLSWWAKDSYLQQQSNGEVVLVITEGTKKISLEDNPLWPRLPGAVTEMHRERMYEQTIFNSKHVLITSTTSPLSYYP